MAVGGAPSYVVPKVALDQSLITTMKEDFGLVDINLNDFSQPSADRWKRYWVIILAKLNHTEVENLDFFPVATTTLDHPELYDEAVTTVITCNCLKTKLAKIGYGDFQLTDITCPSKKRLLVILSQVINFMRFYADRLCHIEEIEMQNQHLLEKRESLKAKNEEMKKKIDLLLAERTQRQAAADSMKKPLQEKYDRLAEMQVTANNLKQQSSSLNEQLTQIQASNAEKTHKIAELEDVLNQIVMQIVSDPEKAKAEIEHLLCTVERLHRIINEERMPQQMRNRVELGLQHAAECEQALKLIIEVQSLQAASVQLQERKAALVDSCRSLPVTALMDRIQLMKRVGDEKMARIDKLVLQHDMKTRDERYKLEELMAEKNSVMAALNEHALKIYEQHKAVRDDIQQLAEGHEHRMQVLEQDLIELSNWVVQYKTKLLQAYEESQRRGEILVKQMLAEYKEKNRKEKINHYDFD